MLSFCCFLLLFVIVGQPVKVRVFMTLCTPIVIKQHPVFICCSIVFAVAFISFSCYMVFIYLENQVSQIANVTEKDSTVNKQNKSRKSTGSLTLPTLNLILFIFHYCQHFVNISCFIHVRVNNVLG